MITTKKLLITSVFLFITQTCLLAQFNLFKYGAETYYPFDSTSINTIPHELIEKNFKHRLVVPIITDSTLFINYANDTLSLVQFLDSLVFQEEMLYGPTHLLPADNEEKSAILKRMKIVSIEEDLIEFKGLLKVKGKKKEWVNFTIPVSDLSGIFVGTPTYIIPLVATGTIIGVAIIAVISAEFEEDY